MALGTTNTKLLKLTGGRCGSRSKTRSKSKKLSKRRIRKIPTSQRRSRSRSKRK